MGKKYNSKDEIPNNSFSEKLTALMNYFDLEATDLEKELNVTARTIKSWKKGKSKPADKNFQDLLNYFKLNEGYFLNKFDNFIIELFIANNIQDSKEIEEFKSLNNNLKEIIKLSNGFKGNQEEINDLKELLNNIVIEIKNLNKKKKKSKKEIRELQNSILNNLEKKEKKIDKKINELEKLEKNLLEHQKQLIEYQNRSFWAKFKGLFTSQEMPQSEIPVLDRQNE